MTPHGPGTERAMLLTPISGLADFLGGYEPRNRR